MSQTKYIKITETEARILANGIRTNMIVGVLLSMVLPIFANVIGSKGFLLTIAYILAFIMVIISLIYIITYSISLEKLLNLDGFPNTKYEIVKGDNETT